MNNEYEVVLRELITKHFWSEELEWSWVEGTTLKDVDENLYLRILSLVPDLINEK